MNSAATILGASAAASELIVEHAYLRRQTESDSATIHLFVHNPHAEPVEILSLLSVEESRHEAPSSEVHRAVARILAAEDEDEPCLWWRALPNPVPGGGFADVALKLSSTPTHKVTVQFACSGGSKLNRTLSRINDGLELSFVGFSPELDTLYAYIENRLDAAVRIKSVRMNGEDVTARSRSLWGSMKPHGKDCVILPLRSPLRRGAFVFLQVHADQESAQCAGLVRAFSGFPITWLDGSLPDGLEDPREKAKEYRRGQVPNEGLAGYENIMRCPAHAHGTRREAASKFIHHHRCLLASEPEVPGMILVCRWEKEVNYFVFSELADVVRVMPFARSFAYTPEPLEDRTQWLTSLAVCAAAPRPVHAVVPIRFADSYTWTRSCTPQEIRALVYFPLSRGAKGLCYGKRLGGLSQESQQMLAQVTKEIASIRKYLQFSDYMPLGTTDNSGVEAATLLAGDSGVALLLINHHFQDFDNDHILEYVPQKEIRSTIRLPPGFTVASLKDVTVPQGRVRWRQEGDRVTLETDRLELVRPYLIALRRMSTRGASVAQDVN